MKKLKRGRGKYKGKFPFKCFACGGVGHFSSKCPYKENGDNAKIMSIKKMKDDTLIGHAWK